MEENNNPFVKTVKEILQTAFISFGIFLFVYVFLVQPHRVQGVSMEPNFENSELLLTEKISYKLSSPKRGDVIVFQAPVSRKVDFIKRIIGLPGETVKIENGTILINNHEYADRQKVLGQTLGDKTVVLGKDEYFVLGDNRSASSDSRTFGSIKKNSIRGKVWFIYWPIAKSNNFQGARFISEKFNYDNNL